MKFRLGLAAACAAVALGWHYVDLARQGGRIVEDTPPPPRAADAPQPVAAAELGLAQLEPQPGAPGLEEVLTAARRAGGYDRLPGAGENLLLQGTAHFRGMVGRYSLLFNSAGCFLQEVAGPLSVATGFDGRAGWTLAHAHAAEGLRADEVAIPQLVTWVLTGRWLAARGPFRVALPAPSAAGPVILSLQLRSTGEHATLELDRATWLPTALKRRLPAYSEDWRFQEHRTALGIRYPGRVIRYGPEETEVYQLRALARAPRFAQDPYAPMGLRLGAAPRGRGTEPG
jgi:hypothetical protein